MSKDSGDFMLIASGPTRHAPFLAGWQEYKDHLRKYMRRQPGWTDVYSGPRKGEMQGWCRLSDRDEAELVYDTFIKSRGVLVHLFETPRSSSDYKMLTCNCWAYFPDIAEGSHSPRRSGIDVGGVNQMLGRGCTVSTPRYAAPATSMYQYAAYTQNYTNPQAYRVDAAAAQLAAMQIAAPQAPVYSTSSNGMPVNVRHGAMLTEARGIFIQNLNFSVGPSELNSLLSTVGRPVESKLHKDSRTGQFRGTATAKFATKEEAEYAAYYLNRRQHLGMTLHVRLDTEKTVVGHVEPVIANGSTVSSV
ncbi:hypothetical protein BDV95DRAFT_480615 [Massariosphaeria phaeospora]|uniref:RRM domain-containing protein n=1 Tax=Massariosphaeria phaeospora TaxID=100035 RepID=A0A7C8MX14_9PLEO|nr:hypothetical protein BDV95DRAFT_480615 [Massariosphaeria phaeospora]